MPASSPSFAASIPENITYYFRRVMVIASDKASGMAVWRKSLFATMHLNANLPARISEFQPRKSWRLVSKSKYSAPGRWTRSRKCTGIYAGATLT
ncbi:MAG TPA: hypothetical protein VI009_01300 [Xanthobacteraceae bacterium]